jgi:hypothetical protein
MSVEQFMQCVTPIANIALCGLLFWQTKVYDRCVKTQHEVIIMQQKIVEDFFRELQNKIELKPQFTMPENK